MSKDIGIGVGAGLVAALLFGVVLKASALAILYLLAPLPILIVGLGWSHRGALAAVIAGALALTLVVSPSIGLAFAAVTAIPAWWLVYLALLGRTGPDGTLEWYPTGRLLAWIAGTAALAPVAFAVIVSPDYATFRNGVTTMSRAVVQLQVQRGRLPAPPAAETPGDAKTRATEAEPTGPEGSDAGKSDLAKSDSGKTDPAKTDPAKSDDLANEVADAFAKALPFLAAQMIAMLFTLYLWAAARIVQVSGRLPRPWPDIPATVMPRVVLLVLVGAFALSLAPGFVGVLGMALMGALSAAFALQGLAAFHDRSRGRPGRLGLLVGLYVVLFLTQGLAMLALVLFGIADTALDRRRPQARGSA